MVTLESCKPFNALKIDSYFKLISGWYSASDA